MLHPADADLLTGQDTIYQHYANKESWCREKVRHLNRQLISQNKPIINLGLFDVLSKDILYGRDADILLVEHQTRDQHLISKKIVEIPNSIYGIYYIPDSQKHWHRSIAKDFNCFINRNDPARQAWFYLIYDRLLLDRGYVSFSAVARPGLVDMSDVEYFEKIHRETLSAFDKVYQDVKKIIPYKNFLETGDLRDTIMATKFSIVIETYFERTDAVTFSEKTFRVLQTPRPWLLFHATNSIKTLRDFGFYVYDDFVDHSYDEFDTTDSFVKRQEGMFKQISDLMNLDVTPSMLDHWEKKTLKNCEILRDLNQIWQKDFELAAERAYNLAMS